MEMLYGLVDSGLKLFVGIFCILLIAIAVIQIIKNIEIISRHIQEQKRMKNALKDLDAEKIAKKIFGEDD